MSGGLFLWWRSITSAGKDEVGPEEIAIDETVKQEVVEMEETLNHMSVARPSVVSKGKYNRWATAESKRLEGEQSRTEMESLEEQRHKTTAEFLEHQHERTAQAKEQRETAAERVRQHKADMQAKALEAKHELEERRQADTRRKAQWQETTLKLAQVHGTDQKERVLESRTELSTDRRNAAADAKQAEQDRAEEYKATVMRKLEEKRQRVALIRAQTTPDVARQAKEHFVKARRDVANDVRASVRDWKAEKGYNHQQKLTMAKLNRTAAQMTRGSVIEQRNVLLEARQKDATAIRNNLQAIKDKKVHLKLSAEIKKREAHDEAFESRYVAAAQAEAVVGSTYDTLANTHRDELAAREGRPSRIVGKPNWFPFFGGVTGGWFGGQHTDMCAL